MQPFYLDITYKTGLNNCLVQEHIYELMEISSFEEEYELDGDDFEDIIKSYLHKVASKLAIISQYDTICWIIYHINVKTCTIVNIAYMVVGSFRPNDITRIFNLYAPKV